jgi:hypothetical protein
VCGSYDIKLVTGSYDIKLVIGNWVPSLNESVYENPDQITQIVIKLVV